MGWAVGFQNLYELQEGSMSFPTPDPEIFAEWGESVTFTPSGHSGETVKVVRDDSQMYQELIPGALAVLFGTMDDSGFSRLPAKNDSFTIDGKTYRVFEVKTDLAGGTAGSRGIFIGLAA